jgi:hypothetical protein
MVKCLNERRSACDMSMGRRYSSINANKKLFQIDKHNKFLGS